MSLSVFKCFQVFLNKFVSHYLLIIFETMEIWAFRITNLIFLL